MLTLDIELRDKSQNLENLREEGKMPAVLYGKKTESTPISISKKEFIHAWHVAGESTVVTLKSPKGSFDTLIHEVDLDPVTDVPRHADFYVFEKGKKVDVSVPLEFVGVSPAVKDLGGSFVKSLHELKISADPMHIPHQIEVDISSLVDFNSQILAGDVKLPTGVELKEMPTQVVAAATPPREEKIEEEAPVDLSTIEVEKKGKKEEEGEAEAPAPAPVKEAKK